MTRTIQIAQSRDEAGLRRAFITQAIRTQADSCRDYESPLTGAILDAVARDLEDGGISAELLADWAGHPVLDALPMRFLGAVHDLVLAGRAPELCAHFPSVGGRPGPAAPALFVAALAQHRGWVRARLDTPVQTNEVRRSAALLGGFLAAAHATRRPLALLEIGASGGLNQIFDRYRFELGDHGFGPAESPLRLRTAWTGPPPHLEADLRVATRGGCDIAPIDLEDATARRRLESFVWADQPERLERLRTAIGMARELGVEIERAPAGDWLDARLALPQAGVTRVVFHSVVWWYLPEHERRRVTEIIEAAGARASQDAPLAWLRMEGTALDFADLRLRLWPGAQDILLGRTRYHGQEVQWEGAEVPRGD